jgi:tetratricopeptide (TPR) repeat protein
MLQRRPQARAAFAALVDLYGDAGDERVQRAVIDARIDEADLERRTGATGRALGLYDELVDRYADHRDGPPADAVSRALFKRAELIEQLGRFDDALAEFDRLVADYGKDPPARNPWVALDSAYRAARTLERLGRIDDAVSAWRALVQRYGDQTELPTRRGVASALTGQAMIAARQGRETDALALEDELIARCQHDPEPELRQRVADTLALRVRRQLIAGQSAAARISSDQLMGVFAQESEPDSIWRIGPAVIRIARAFIEVKRVRLTAALNPVSYARHHTFETNVVLTHAARAARHPTDIAQALRRGGARSTRWVKELRQDLTHAVTILDLAVARCDQPTDPRLYAIALQSRFQRALALNHLGHLRSLPAFWRWLATTGQPGLAALDQWASYLEQFTDQLSRSQLAETLMMKTVLLGDQGATTQRRELLRHITARFAHDDSRRARLLAHVARWII